MGAFIRRWWFIGVALLGVGAWQARLESEVAQKPSLSAFEELRRDVREIRDKLEDMDSRQRAFFCKDQQPWCR